MSSKSTKQTFGRSLSQNDTALSARVYHPATNLMPATPPTSPTGVAPNFPPRYPNMGSRGQQNSYNKSW
ncbi:hypothetical protein O3G_MSEX012831 [Manduca sexta]|uniref:Uncharacterized protein n=1 Tax=Manduca sexta TaxID=7130 RepID=A0A922CX85_MANSE|nr:hypothetical protein O3G_MSEX012831 [Manduca sexta]